MALTKEQAEASNLVIGTLPILGRAARVLVNLGASLYFASEEFYESLACHTLERQCDVMVDLPSGDYMHSFSYLEGVAVEVEGHQLLARLYALQLCDFASSWAWTGWRLTQPWLISSGRLFSLGYLESPSFASEPFRVFGSVGGDRENRVLGVGRGSASGPSSVAPPLATGAYTVLEAKDVVSLQEGGGSFYDGTLQKEKELKRPPTFQEVFDKTHKKKGTDQYISDRSREVAESYSQQMIEKYAGEKKQP
ncbi:hypothetical protein Taro_052697 [Colocasia esculenta]|uniref:Uncharacterized protein n=2 Tax=Colocasia esculenta TaxID=4460 RepID=A0A843XJC9_COLES|nr:hypothetical protein [Colocasia esculenta]